MKNSRYNKIFFEKAFSVARMKPYFNRYPGDETRGEMLNKLHQTRMYKVLVFCLEIIRQE